jgi:hypothetical protein
MDKPQAHATVITTSLENIWRSMWYCSSFGDIFEDEEIRTLKALFHNLVGTLLAQTEFSRYICADALNKLGGFIQKGKSIRGLETIFLTLLYEPSSRLGFSPDPFALELWRSFAKSSFLDAGPIYFYRFSDPDAPTPAVFYRLSD